MAARSLERRKDTAWCHDDHHGMQDGGITLPLGFNADWWLKELPTLIGGICFTVGGYLTWMSTHKSMSIAAATYRDASLRVSSLYLVVWPLLHASLRRSCGLAHVHVLGMSKADCWRVDPLQGQSSRH